MYSIVLSINVTNRIINFIQVNVCCKNNKRYLTKLRANNYFFEFNMNNRQIYLYKCIKMIIY